MGRTRYKERQELVFDAYSKSTFFACAGITLYDIVIDKIHFSKDARYQKALVADSEHVLEETKNDVRSIFPTVSSRAHFLYSQAAYWVAIGAITFDEAADAYPEKADYITEMFQLFNKIEREEDLEWAFPKAKEIYFDHFRM